MGEPDLVISINSVVSDFISSETNLWRCSATYLPPPGGGTPVNSWWGYAARFFKSWPDFRARNVIFHTRFQTRHLKSIPVFRPGLWAGVCYRYLLFKLFKSISNSHISLSFLAIWNWKDKSVHTLPSSLENHTRFQTKMGTVYTSFQAKTAQKPYPMGRHILIWLL